MFQNNFKPTCLLTIDVEEWFQVENLKSVISPYKWETYPSTVSSNINLILNLFAEQNVKGTFFILGWVAERNPEMVLQIVNQGHEVASHGYGHSITNVLNADQLYNDIKKSKQILEDLTKNKIHGYRAPNFSVNDKVVNILKDLNFTYDSSYNPFQLHSRYGSFNKFTTKDEPVFELENKLIEVSVASLKIGKYDFPIGGGAYFRIFPFFLFKNLALYKCKKDKLYNFYLHPWEFEPDQPRIKGIGLSHRLRHYTGLNRTAYRLKKLIQTFKQNNFLFLTIRDYLNLDIPGGK